MAEKLTNDLKEKIRLEFLEGEVLADGTKKDISIDALVKKYGVARATLFRTADRENWQEERIKFRSEYREKLSKQRMGESLKEAEKLDKTCLTLTNAFLARIIRQLRTTQEAEGADPLNPERLRQLTAAALNAQKLGKLALGEPQEITKVDADISIPDAFAEVIRGLDEIAASRAQEFSPTLQ